MYKVYGGLSLSLCWIEWPWNKLAIMHVHCHFHRLSTSTNQIHCGTLTYASGKTDLLRRIGYRSFISSALTSVSSASCVNTYLSIITTISSTKRCFFVQEVFIVFDKNIYIYTLPAWFTLHVQLLVALRLSSPKFSPTIPHHESKKWFKTWTTPPFHRFLKIRRVFSGWVLCRLNCVKYCRWINWPPQAVAVSQAPRETDLKVWLFWWKKSG